MPLAMKSPELVYATASTARYVHPISPPNSVGHQANPIPVAQEGRSPHPSPTGNPCSAGCGGGGTSLSKGLITLPFAHSSSKYLVTITECSLVDTMLDIAAFRDSDLLRRQGMVVNSECNLCTHVCCLYTYIVILNELLSLSVTELVLYSRCHD